MDGARFALSPGWQSALYADLRDGFHRVERRTAESALVSAQSLARASFRSGTGEYARSFRISEGSGSTPTVRLGNIADYALVLEVGGVNRTAYRILGRAVSRRLGS